MGAFDNAARRAADTLTTPYDPAMGRGGHSDDEATPYDQRIEEVEFMRGACAAAQRGDLGCLKGIIDRRPKLLADDGVGGASGYTPLHYASREGHLDCVTFLIKQGARVDQSTSSGNATALHRAAYTGQVKVVKALLAAGADALLRDADNETPLHKGCAFGSVGCVEVLLEACPDARYVKDRHGETPLERIPKDAAATRAAFDRF